MSHPDRAAEQRRQQYAQDLTTRFEAYRQWAIANWPVTEQPLTETAFVAARRELELIKGAMLHPGEKPAGAMPPPTPAAGGEQYQDVTPAPWP